MTFSVIVTVRGRPWLILPIEADDEAGALRAAPAVLADLTHVSVDSIANTSTAFRVLRDGERP